MALNVVGAGNGSTGGGEGRSAVRVRPVQWYPNKLVTGMVGCAVAVVW